jgi:hypothetical protein
MFPDMKGSSMAKRIYERWTTPAGIAVWPKLVTPDTKFSPEGEYSVSVKFGGDEAKTVVTRVKQLAKAAYESLCREQGKPKLKVAQLPLQQDEEGNWILKTKLKAKVTTTKGTSWEQRPAIFDSRGVPMKPEEIPNIGGGSVIKACVEIAPYYTATIGAGITLRLRGVQIITLVEYGSGEVNAAAMGFTEEEQGYVAGGETFPLDEGPTVAAVEEAGDDEEIPF